MGMTDPISDMLTRIRNAQMVGRETVDVPASKIKQRIAEILVDEGYVSEVTLHHADQPQRKTLRLALRYSDHGPVIEEIKRISKPGRRVYIGKDNIPQVYKGLGVAIMSTNLGVISSREALKKGVGGEVLCTVF